MSLVSICKIPGFLFVATFFAIAGCNHPSGGEYDKQSQQESELEERPAEGNEEQKIAPSTPADVIEDLGAGIAEISRYIAGGPELEQDEDRCSVSESDLYPSVVVTFEDDRREIYSLHDCEQFIDRIEHGSPPEFVGSEQWELELSSVTIRHRGEPIITYPCVSSDQLTCLGDNWEWSYRLDSVIGPVVSLRTHSFSQAAGGRGTRSVRGQSIDLRDGEQAALTAVVTEASLLEALKEASELRSILGTEELAAAESVTAIEELIDDRSEIQKFGQYSFYEWAPKRNQVAMRVWYHEPSAGVGNAFIQSLDLWVTPDDDYRHYFEAAADGEGLYMTSEDRPQYFDADSFD